MGYNNRAEAEAETCLSEALLFATMCIIGLPVDVHIRDGSVYSGTFHTASVDKDYGIVLKEAKLSKKGKCNSNVANGSVIETLIILSDDIVQVVAKGVLFPADGVTGNITGDDVEAAVTHETVVSNVKISNKSTVEEKKINQNRQIGDDRSQEDQDHNYDENSEFQREKSADEVQNSSSSLGSCLIESSFEEGQVTKLLPNGESCDHAPALTRLDNECCVRPVSAGNSSPDAVCSMVSTTSSPVVDVTLESHGGSSATSTDIVSPQSSESNRSSKEFKLNPGAKIFSPSFANPILSSPAVPTVAGMAYIPSNTPIPTIATSQPEVGISPFAPRSSVTAKFAPYNNLTSGNVGGGAQFSQPIVGLMGNRAQPVRYTGQYHAVQAGQAYVPPNSQAVMVGRMGQVVYVQPVPHDLVQSTAAISPASARPILTPHQVQFPKHQGSAAAGQTLQLCVPPHIIAGGQQPFAVPSPIPLLQPPIPANRPIPVPGSNAIFGTKFP